MKVKQYDNQEERQILIAAITNDEFAKRLASIWNPKESLFASKYAELIAGWVVKFVERYGTAPHEKIEVVFRNWCRRKTQNEQLIDAIDDLLLSLSDDSHITTNVDFLTDLAQQHFTRTRLRRLSEDVESLLLDDNVESAQRKVETFDAIKFGGQSVFDVVRDEDGIRQALSEQHENLIAYKGELADFFGTMLERDGFISFLAPEKRGKSWWILDAAYRAACQGNRVLYFECGDLSKNQAYRRFLQRICKHPRFACNVKIPERLTIKGDEIDVRHVVKNFRRDLPLDLAVTRARSQSVRLQWKFSAHPADTLSVRMIEDQIETLSRSGWVPDVVVIDYADILANPSGITEERDAINANWKRLRSISQRFHNLVITATQSDAASYGVPLLTRTNFSGDKRKLAHVTGMVGINQTPEEQSKGVYRLNWVAGREIIYTDRDVCYTAACLPLANPCVLSRFPTIQ